MTTERGQRTTIRFGGVRAEVSLVKTSGKPKGAQHETKRVLADGPPPPPDPPTHFASEVPGEFPALADPLGMDTAIDGARDAVAESIRTGTPASNDLAARQAVHEDAAPEVSEAFARRDEATADPLGDPVDPPSVVGALERDVERIRTTIAAKQRRGHEVPESFHADLRAAEQRLATTRPADPLAPIVAPGGVIPAGVDATGPAHSPETYGLGDERAEQMRAAPAREHPTDVAAHEYVAPATTVQQGVHLDDGTWVDLTERLREVDERTRLEWLEVVATIHQGAVLRERVRDAHYVAGVKPSEYPVLALLWHGLREADRAAAVVWTKKTAQALGFIVARGTLGEDAHLILLELEWAENMKAPGPRALGPIRAAVSDEQKAAARDLVDAFAKPPAALNELRDMRLAKRAELLELARAGKLEAYDPPPEPRADVDLADLAAALGASAAAVR